MDNYIIHKVGGGQFIVPESALDYQRRLNGRIIERVERIGEPQTPDTDYLDNMSVEDMRKHAEILQLPKNKWQRMGEEKLRNYLKEQTK